ncbi:MAG: IS110 family transposase [Desulfovibrio sp.]|nr:IS110 family transposase [Desulfovibrio sp.]
MDTVTNKRCKGKREQTDFAGKVCWVGVDAHKSSYAVAVSSEDGQRLEFSTPAEPKKFLLQLLKMGMVVKALTYESGPTGYGLAWACQESGIPVVMAAPSRIPRPVSKTGKTDRLDSMKLVEFLARDMLKGIAIPSREEFALREIERARQHLVKRRREARQNIRAFLLRNGLEEPPSLTSWTLTSIRVLQEMPLAENLRLSLDSYLEDHANILESLSRITKQLAEAADKLGHGERIKNLRTIPGVGVTIAHTFISEIFRPERFKRAEDICAYVGLAPVTSHSGSSKERAWIRQVGQRYLRSILVEAAWKLVASEGYYRDFYNRIRSRTKFPQKAIVAVAHKLLVLIWRIAIGGRPYRPATAD